MTTLLALFLLAQAAPPPAADDIVVLGERMRRLKLVTRTDRRTGISRCVFKRRSGDPAFDTLMCDAVLACATRVKTGPEMQACLAPTISDYARTLTALPSQARSPR